MRVKEEFHWNESWTKNREEKKKKKTKSDNELTQTMTRNKLDQSEFKSMRKTNTKKLYPHKTKVTPNLRRKINPKNIKQKYLSIFFENILTTHKTKPNKTKNTAMTTQTANTLWLLLHAKMGLAMIPSFSSGRSPLYRAWELSNQFKKRHQTLQANCIWDSPSAEHPTNKTLHNRPSPSLLPSLCT